MVWWAQHLVLEGGRQAVVEHLLVEDGGDAARHGRHDPDPVGRTAPPAAVLVLHVLDEGLGGRVVIHDGHLVTLRGQESRASGRQRSPEGKSQNIFFGAVCPKYPHGLWG